jgi:hypothetical protein
MPIRKVTDPSILSQLGGGNVVAPNALFPAQSRKANAEADTAVATAPYAGTKAEADARKAEADARKAQAEASVGPSPNFVPSTPGYIVTGPPTAPRAVQIAGLPGAGVQLDAAQRAKAIQQYNYAQQLQGVVDHLNSLYNKGPGATKGLRGIEDMLPTPNNVNFDTAANQARGVIGQTLNFTGGQLNTPEEAKKAVGPFLPQSSDWDSTIVQKISALEDMAKNGQQNAIQTLGGVPDANGVVHPVTQSSQLPPITTPHQDQATFATGKTRDLIDPALKATGQRVGRMIADGVPDAKIVSFLQKSGVDPTNTNVQQALQFRQSPDFKKWQRANPGQAYPIGPDFYTKQIPMTPARSLVNKAAASDMGGTALAAGAGMTNAIMGDRLGSAVGALTGEPGTAQTGMELLQSNHPAADLAGNAAGQAAIEGVAGGIPGVSKLLASPWGRRGADALYGAYYGSGDNSGDNPAMGAAGGALVNAIGGMAGRGLQKGVGKAMTGVVDPQAKYLSEHGIPLTIGQIGHGSENVVGHAIGGIEDRAAGLPVFDAIINSARRRGEEGFNQAAFKQAGGSGLTGAAGVQELKGNLNKAYSFLDPVKLPLDAQFAGSQAAVRAGLPGLPKYGPEIGAGLNLIDKASADGSLTGRDWQQALRTVKSDKASLKGKEFSQGATDTLGDVENNLLDLAQRQSPDALKNNLASANDLNKKFNTITSALDNGPTQARGELFSASRLNTASLANGRKFGGRTSALTGNRPFYDLTTAGMDVMPNQVPDSGTAGRALLYSTLFGGGLGGGIGAAFSPNDRGGGAEEGGKLGLAIPLAVASLYSKGGQGVAQKLLLGDRPDRMVKIGNFLINRSHLAGILGSSAARQGVYQPGLPQ